MTSLGKDKRTVAIPAEELVPGSGTRVTAYRKFRIHGATLGSLSHQGEVLRPGVNTAVCRCRKKPDHEVADLNKNCSFYAMKYPDDAFDYTYVKPGTVVGVVACADRNSATEACSEWRMAPRE